MRRHISRRKGRSPNFPPNVTQWSELVVTHVRYWGVNRTRCEHTSLSQIDPNETSALDRRRADRSRLRLHQALLQPCKSSAAYSRINSYLMGKSASVAISHVSHTRRLRDP